MFKMIVGKAKHWLRRMAVKSLFPADQSRGWIPVFQESYIGAFQIDDPVSLGDALAHPTVYACVTQIASDIGKLRWRLTRLKDGIYEEVPAYNPVFRKPNPFQTRQKFIEAWMISKLTFGNTYVLKQRDEKGRVAALYVLDPQKIAPLVAGNGEVFYRAKKDNLSRMPKDIPAIPAHEIIHDMMECLFHPLVGVPPLYAASLATSQGLSMQQNSARFFQNNAQPGGILSAPGHIKNETAKRIKAHWSDNYTGDNVGEVAVLGDGLRYEPLMVNATDSAMVEQLKWTDEKICSAYKVPPYKVHVGTPPTARQSETLDRQYYSDCLQRHIEAIEVLLDEGLELFPGFGTEFNLDDLMRMDLLLKMRVASEGVKGAIFAPNEARKKFNLPPVQGGSTPYLQQQNYSLAALDERDQDKPFAKPAPAMLTAPVEPAEENETDKMRYLLIRKSVVAELEEKSYRCECIECGHKMESEKHCKEIKCPKCGGQMRREERPGPGQP